MKVVLSIAGSDSGGGAGIQADIKTLEAHHCFGITAITALTAQNTQGVAHIHTVPSAFIAAQLDALVADFNLSAVKVGMLGGAAQASVVARFLSGLPLSIPRVVDPVMVSTSGHSLLPAAALRVLIKELLPQATVITPNIPEAEKLLGRQPILNLAQAKEAAQALAGLYPNAYILIKGAHLLETTPERLESAHAKDILFYKGECQVFAQPFLEVGPLHGTGCTLSSAIAANLAHGYAVPKAVQLAKEYITNAILTAPKRIGHGSTPLRHNQSSYQ